MLFLDLLQNPAVAVELKSRLPAFKELVYWYGPYLGLVVSLVITIIVMQYVWYKTNIRAKGKEIARLEARDIEMFERMMHMLDKQTGFK